MHFLITWRTGFAGRLSAKAIAIAPLDRTILIKKDDSWKLKLDLLFSFFIF